MSIGPGRSSARNCAKVSLVGSMWPNCASPSGFARRLGRVASRQKRSAVRSDFQLRRSVCSSSAPPRSHQPTTAPLAKVSARSSPTSRLSTAGGDRGVVGRAQQILQFGGGGGESFDVFRPFEHGPKKSTVYRNCFSVIRMLVAGLGGQALEPPRALFSR